MSSTQYAGKMPATEEDERELFRSVAFGPIVTLLLMLLLITMPFSLLADSARDDKTTLFDIPQQRADSALTDFAEQANLTLIFPFDDVREISANRLAGRYTIEKGITLLLDGTGLEAAVDGDGQISIVRAQSLGESNTMYKKNKLSGAILAVLTSMFGAEVSAAVDTTGTGSTELLEEIVVTAGYRKSLEAALDMKRYKTGFVDAIVATDIAAFPDQNLAEAMQRIPGVAIERSLGQGTQVNVRALGSSFTHTTINGISASSSSGGRAVDFQLFSSGLVQSIAVNKSPTAEDEEGGIAGVVAIQTPRPFDYDGFRALVSGEAAYNDYSEEKDPSFGLMLSNLFLDDTLGVLFSYTAEDRTSRADYFDTNGMHLLNSKFNVGEYPEGDDELIFPNNHRAGTYLNAQEKWGAILALEYRPTDNLEIAADFLTGNYHEDRDFYQSQSYYGGADGITNITADSNGVITSATLLGNENNIQNYEQQSNNDFWMMDVSAKWNVNELWTVSGLLGANRTDTNIGERNFNWWDTDADTHYQLNGEVVDRWTDDYTFDEAGGSFEFRRFTETATIKDDKKSVVQLDFERLIEESSWIEEVQFGVRYASKSTEDHDYRTRYNAGDVPHLASEDGIQTLSSVVDGSDFLGGYGIGGSPRTWMVVPIETAIAIYDSVDYPFPEERNDQYYFVEENTLAAYVQADMSFEISDLPTRVNLGLRYVETEQSSEGELDDGSDFCDDNFCINAVERAYEDWLPSLSMNIDLTEDLVLRFAAAKTMTRPSLGDLSGRITLSERDFTADGTNPYLDPTRAKQADLSLEYYFAPESLLSLGIFHKDLDNFSSKGGGEETIIIDGDAYTLFTLDNSEGATISGAEFIYQQPFNFLPSPFDGLGMNFNYTYLDSNAGTTTVTGAEAPLTGLSANSFNAVVYYEKYGADVRLSYNYRDESVNGVSRDRFFAWNDEYAQLDFSAGYQLTDSVKLTLKVINLTDEYASRYYDYQGGIYPHRVYAYGRRASLGVRASF